MPRFPEPGQFLVGVGHAHHYSGSLSFAERRDDDTSEYRAVAFRASFIFAWGRLYYRVEPGPRLVATSSVSHYLAIPIFESSIANSRAPTPGAKDASDRTVFARTIVDAATRVKDLCLIAEHLGFFADLSCSVCDTRWASLTL